MHKTNKEAAPSPKNAASTTNESDITTAATRGATPERREWRPVTIGEVIERIIADIGMEVRP